jgi:hypothetical protein
MPAMAEDMAAAFELLLFDFEFTGRRGQATRRNAQESIFQNSAACHMLV